MKMESPITLPCQSDSGTYDAKHGHPLPPTVFGRLRICFREMIDWLVFKPCPPYLPILLRKFIFNPKRSTYFFAPKPNKVGVYNICIREGCETLVSEDHRMPPWLMNVNCYYVEPTSKTKLACRYIRTPVTKSPLFVIFFCHANAVDIGFDINFHYYAATRLRSDFFTFDYSGYGQSSGKATESNFYDDTFAAYEFLTNTLKVPSRKIVLFGQSLGTAAAIDLASRNVPVSGLILEGLLLSAIRVLFPTMKFSCFCDQVDSSKKVSLIQCPTLVLHGGLDSITKLENAEAFISKSMNLVPPLIIPSGKHLDLMNYRAYWQRIEIFLAVELAGRSQCLTDWCNPFCRSTHKNETVTDATHMDLEWPFVRDVSIQL